VLLSFGVWTENPRVGGSIPPLATINQEAQGLARALIFQLFDIRSGVFS
jgi:hypothetical protein